MKQLKHEGACLTLIRLGGRGSLGLDPPGVFWRNSKRNGLRQFKFSYFSNFRLKTGFYIYCRGP